MTSTRSGCWVAMVWTTAVGFCLSPLFGRSTARYYSEAYVCVVVRDDKVSNQTSREIKISSLGLSLGVETKRFGSSSRPEFWFRLQSGGVGLYLGLKNLFSDLEGLVSLDVAGGRPSVSSTGRRRPPTSSQSPSCLPSRRSPRSASPTSTSSRRPTSATRLSATAPPPSPPPPPPAPVQCWS